MSLLYKLLGLHVDFLLCVAGSYVRDKRSNRELKSVSHESTGYPGTNDSSAYRQSTDPLPPPPPKKHWWCHTGGYSRTDGPLTGKDIAYRYFTSHYVRN